MDDERHSFRCPVCGHVDEAETRSAETRVACSHCGSRLVLGPPRKGEVGVSARLSDEDRSVSKRRRERSTS